jgi:hypothetical protein
MDNNNNIFIKYKETYSKKPYQSLLEVANQLKCLISNSMNISQDGGYVASKTQEGELTGVQD